jgi:hypothetical protein
VSDADRYLADLRRALPRGQRRRILTELRGHLTDGIAAEVARGVEPDEAERLTIDRLGSPEQLASQFASTGRRMSIAMVAALGATVFVVVLAAVVSFASTRHAPTGSTTIARNAAPAPLDSRRRMLVAQLELLRRNLVLATRHRP